MDNSEILLNVLFYVFAAVALAGAVAVALSRNIVRSAFSLLAVLFAAAGLYGVMKSDFILAVQVIIYVGGILVLIIFAIMLTHKITDINISNESTPGPAAFFACLCLLFSLVVVVVSFPRWKRDPEPPRTAVEPAPVSRFEGARALQYQGDGATGIAAGGDTLDRDVVLKLTVPKSIPATDAEFQIVPTERKEEPLVKSISIAVDPERDVRAGTLKLEGLAEGGYRWSYRLLGEKGPLSDWMIPESTTTGRPNFVVRRGIVEAVGYALMGPYLLPFEIVSVLLLAALVGAAFLARKEVKE